MTNIDKEIDKKLNLIVDRYLKLNIPFKNVKNYLTSKNIDKVINELTELETIYLKKHEDKNNKDFKLIIKDKIINILKDRKYNYMDKNENLKHLNIFKSFKI
jgi:hypothetical protein